jgi:Reverse transcriptase (RNA-dependent DNA polymerase)
MIKREGMEMIIWMKEIFNICIEIEDIPKCWKLSWVRMLRKDLNVGSNLAYNYRWITLLSIMYKIFTAILTKRTSKVVEKNKLIGELQFGFRKNKSTRQAIRILTNVYEDAMVEDKELWVTFLDIQKAYDTVEF